MVTSVVVACPVANRDWALPTWYEALAKQTVRPAAALMIHGGHKGDDTWQAIERCAGEFEIPTHRIHEGSPPHDRLKPADADGRREADDARFHTLARLRNQMLGAVTMFTDATHLLSLDSDIFLEDPHSIENLLAASDPAHAKTMPDVLRPIYWPDVIAPLVYFNPDADWTCNAGLLGNRLHHPREALEAGRPEDLGTWPWSRVSNDDTERASVLPIDIPMGAVLMPRRVFSTVRYRWHRSGEDIGFGINLKLAGFTAGWLPSIYARHCWDRYQL